MKTLILAAILGALSLMAWARRGMASPVAVPGAIDDAANYLSVNLGPIFGAGLSPDQDILARTIWGEARGQGRAAMENVASVIMNRYRARRAGKGYASWGPVRGTIAQICQANYQFSCWNATDPNRSKCIAVNTTDAAFKIALEIAGAAIAGTLEDRTGGADHYFASGMVALPNWATAGIETFTDAAHRFRKLVNW